MNDDIKKSFEEITKPVIEWLNNNSHPHTKVIIDSTNAELVEGVTGFSTFEFVKD